MGWKAFLTFIGQHAIQGALVAGASMVAVGKSPFTAEGAAIMGAAAIGTAGNHMREAWGSQK